MINLDLFLLYCVYFGKVIDLVFGISLFVISVYLFRNIFVYVDRKQLIKDIGLFILIFIMACLELFMAVYIRS
jgi:hypothetical protein